MPTCQWLQEKKWLTQPLLFCKIKLLYFLTSSLSLSYKRNGHPGPHRMVFQGTSLLSPWSTGDTFLFLASTPHLPVYWPVISKQIELGLGSGGRNEAGLGKSLVKMLHFLKSGLSSHFVAMLWPWGKHCFLLALPLSLFVSVGYIVFWLSVGWIFTFSR